MSGSGQSSKTIAVLIAIALITVALLGADAWKRNRQEHPPVTKPVAVTPAPAAPTSSAVPGVRRPPPRTNHATPAPLDAGDTPE